MEDVKETYKLHFIQTAFDFRQNRHKAIRQHILAIRRHLENGQDFDIDRGSKMWLYHMSNWLRSNNQSWMERVKK